MGKRYKAHRSPNKSDADDAEIRASVGLTKEFLRGLRLYQGSGCWLVAIFSFIAISFLKIHYSMTQRPFDPQKDTAYYWSESAMQYRFAKIISQGHDIPQVDRSAEYPEGIVTARELTLLMERTTGNAHRLMNSIHPIKFHVFVIYFYGLLSSLPVLVFYLAALGLGGSPLPAVLMTIAYAFSPNSWDRFVGEYIYEGFAFPWLFMSFALYLRILRTRALRFRTLLIYSSLAGISLSIGLISWHFSRFYFLMFMSATLIHYVVYYYEDDDAVGLAIVTAVVTGIACVAGVLFQVLRSNGFLFSPPMLMAYAFLAAHILRKRFALDRAGYLSVFIGTGMALAMGFNVVFQKDASAYGHVYAVYIAKLLHALRKPTDPSELPMEARLLWVSPFNTPALGHILYTLFPSGLLLLFPLAERFRPKSHIEDAASSEEIESFDERPRIFLFSMFFYLLVERLAGLFLFFLCLFALYESSRCKRSRVLSLVVLILVAGISCSMATIGRGPSRWLTNITQRALSEQDQPFDEYQHRKSALLWIEGHTNPNDVFVSGIGFSPLILAYSGRPIVLQPKFEAAKTRDKYAEFLRAMYGTEEKLFDFCMKYGASYLVYESQLVLYDSKDSSRYTGNALTVDSSMAAFRLHFSPQTLKHFQLLYQDMDRRIFKVLKTNADAKPSGFIPYKDPTFAIEEFLGDASERKLHLGDSRKLVEKLSARRAYRETAQALKNKGDYRSAAMICKKALELLPTDAETWVESADLGVRMGQLREATVDLNQALALNPNLLSSYELAASFFLQAGRVDAALPVLRKIVDLNPLDASAFGSLGVIYARKGDLRSSLEYLTKAYQLAPADPDISNNYNIALGVAKKRK